MLEKFHSQLLNMYINYILMNLLTLQIKKNQWEIE